MTSTRGRYLIATGMFAVALTLGGATPDAIAALRRMGRRAYAVAQADVRSEDGLKELMPVRWMGSPEEWRGTAAS